MSGGTWQPIETAPRDGTPVLLTDDETSEHPWAIRVGHPVVAEWGCGPVPGRNEYAPTWVFYRSRNGAVISVPWATHWMPLPGPPERS
jgi:hypothetical protein